jgi:fructuronate reductase
MNRLSSSILSRLPSGVVRPGYDRKAVRTGIVHLGIGAFHRAHQAVHTDQALATGDLRWGILGASLRSPETRDALNPQDCLYTVAVKGPEGTALRVVGSIGSILVAPEDPQSLLRAMAHPDVRIISLTVTEKGYCHDPATRGLKEDHSDVVHDLANPRVPRSAPGFLVAALERRFAAGLPPFTVMTCDNLPSNGKTLRSVVTRFAGLRDPALARRIEDEVAFPCSMVDRIVPATTDADRAAVAAALGAVDAWPVVTEPFTQWVIEDRFPQGRPDWGAAGAEMTDRVEPYEDMKLRLLNGSHSTLAYLGYLSGCETVADAMADEGLAALVEGLMNEEVTPTLAVPPGADLGAYKRSLLARFRNPELRHRTWQIAMDGTQKLPQRLLGTARDRLKDGAPIDRIALGVAAWMRYVSGIDETGAAIDVRDPLAPELKRIAAEAGPSADRLAIALTGLETVFGRDLPADPRFTRPVTAALASLFEKGVRATVRETVARA